MSANTGSCFLMYSALLSGVSRNVGMMEMSSKLLAYTALIRPPSENSIEGSRIERERASSAVINVSRTVKAPNNRAFWKARPMPRRARAALL